MDITRQHWPDYETSLRADSYDKLRVKDNAYQCIVNAAFSGAVIKDLARLPGGVSAEVTRLDLLLPDGTEKSIVLRVHGDTHHGHPAALEYNLLKALHRKGLPVPYPHYVDNTSQFLDHPFLITEFLPGSSAVPGESEQQYFKAAADTLTLIHSTSTVGLPQLTQRTDPVTASITNLPDGIQWDALREYLCSLSASHYKGTLKLLHGDFWPENLFWQDNKIKSAVRRCLLPTGTSLQIWQQRS